MYCIPQCNVLNLPLAVQWTGSNSNISLLTYLYCQKLKHVTLSFFLRWELDVNHSFIHASWRYHVSIYSDVKHDFALSFVHVFYAEERGSSVSTGTRSTRNVGFPCELSPSLGSFESMNSHDVLLFNGFTSTIYTRCPCQKQFLTY